LKLRLRPKGRPTLCDVNRSDSPIRLPCLLPKETREKSGSFTHALGSNLDKRSSARRILYFDRIHNYLLREQMWPNEKTKKQHKSAYAYLTPRTPTSIF